MKDECEKRGVRYRYYVSQALLQNDRSALGSVVRVAAPDVGALVCSALRNGTLLAEGGMGRRDDRNLADRDRDAADEVGLRVEPGRDQLDISIEGSHFDRTSLVRRVERIVLRRDCVEITMRNDADEDSGYSPHDPSSSSASDSLEEVHSSEPNAGTAELPFGRTREEEDPNTSFRILSVPWTPPSMRTRKGIVQTPSSDRPDPAARDALLSAIAKARLWMDELVTGRVSSFAEIASREQKVERHIRRLLPLAFLSPRIIETIADGRARAGVNVSMLTAALPRSWTEQERKFGFA